MPRRRRSADAVDAVWQDEDVLNLVVKAGGDWAVVPLRGVNHLARRVAKRHPVDAVKLLVPPLQLYRRSNFYDRDVKLRLDSLLTFDPDLAERAVRDGNIGKWALSSAVLRPDCLSQQRLCLRVHTTPAVLRKLGVPVEYNVKCRGHVTLLYDQLRVVQDVVAYTDGLWGLLARRHRLLQRRRCVHKITPPAAQERALRELEAILDDANGPSALRAFCTPSRRGALLKAIASIPAVSTSLKTSGDYSPRLLSDGSAWLLSDGDHREVDDEEPDESAEQSDDE